MPSSNVVRELREGWTAFRSRTWLWVVVLAFTVINAVEAAGWSTLGPAIADDTFGRAGWGFVLAAADAGDVRLRRAAAPGPVPAAAARRHDRHARLRPGSCYVLAAEPAVQLLVVASFVGGSGDGALRPRLGPLHAAARAAPPAQPGLRLRRAGVDRRDPDRAGRSPVRSPPRSACATPWSRWPTIAMVAAAVPLCVPAVRRLERTDLDQPAPEAVSA